MSRKLMALLFSSALVLGNVSTTAWSATDLSGNAQSVQTVAAANNHSPLPPGGAAGIKEAQDYEHSALIGLGLVAAIVIIAWILIDDEDEEETVVSSTGT